MEWTEFQAQWPSLFKQGQHVTLIGPTGCGKTRLAEHLIAPRSHVVALGVKHVDDSMSRLLANDWTRIQRWKNRPRTGQRLVLWPKESDLDKIEAVHRTAFTECLQSIYKQGRWCIWTDELRYMTDMIGLKKRFQLMYVAGRSNRISLVSAAQRPSHVPLEAYSQAAHLILFRTGDERDLIRMGGLNGTDAKQVARTVSELPQHHFLHVDLNTGQQNVSKLIIGKKVAK